MPADVRQVIESAGLAQKHINLALVVLDADGKVLRSTIPYIRPPAFRFDPEAQGKDFARQLHELLDGLTLPPAPPADPNRLSLPDVKHGLRVYLTFDANRLNHYRTPTVEAVAMTDGMKAALRHPANARDVAAADLRPLLQQLYPPAIMDGKGGCRRIDGRLRIAPAGTRDGDRWAILQGTVALELDNTAGTRYDGPLTLAIRYARAGDEMVSLRGVGSWSVPKHTPDGRVAETIRMTAAIESRPE